MTLISGGLTTELEKALRFYRTAIVGALSFSFRRYMEDRFVVSDPRTEDTTRSVVRLNRISRVRQLMSKPGIGVNDEMFIDMSGLLMFNGVPNEDQTQIVPINNTTIVGGATDPNEFIFMSVGDLEQKQAKWERYHLRKPYEVSWRIRTPVMMANSTTVLDYLAFRCNVLPFLHSIAIKWSDRRWDARSVGLDVDMYRPENERTEMIILPPLWMDQSMSRLDPNIWGGYENIIRLNYEEYLGRNRDSYQQDLLGFLETYERYVQMLDPRYICDDQPERNEQRVSRIYRGLNRNLNKTLHIPFNRSLNSVDNTWRIRHYNIEDVVDVTADVFNDEDVDGNIHYTSSFEATTLSDDGWYGNGIYHTDTDTPADLPPFMTKRDGTELTSEKSLMVRKGYVARRVVLPDGRFVLKFWLKVVDGRGKIEVIRTNRLRSKYTTMDENTSRVTRIKHFREQYDTLASTVFDSQVGEWQEVWISFDTIDSFFVKNESYPAHEVYIVFSSDRMTEAPAPEVYGQFKVDELNLLIDQEQHHVQIINSVTRQPLTENLPFQDRIVPLEKVLPRNDLTVFEDHEEAFNFTQIDGRSLAVIADHRNGYNLRPSGSSINTWFKVNSEVDNREQVRLLRGFMTVFRKGSSFLPSYDCVINSNRELSFTWYSDNKNRPQNQAPQRGDDGVWSDSSRIWRNSLIHTGVAYQSYIPPMMVNWNDPITIDRYRICYENTNEQPREWHRWFPTDDGREDSFGVPYIPNDNHPDLVALAIDIQQDQMSPLGSQRWLHIYPNDPYLVDEAWRNGPVGAPVGFDPDWQAMNDHIWQFGGTFLDANGNVITVGAGTHVTAWKYFEYHARRAYRMIGVPLDNVLHCESLLEYAGQIETGFVFSPLSYNQHLLSFPARYGFYSPSPDVWSPYEFQAPSPCLYGSPSPCAIEPLAWPVDKCAWGQIPSPSPLSVSPWPTVTVPVGMEMLNAAGAPISMLKLGEEQDHINSTAINVDYIASNGHGLEGNLSPAEGEVFSMTQGSVNPMVWTKVDVDGSNGYGRYSLDELYLNYYVVHFFVTSEKRVVRFGFGHKNGLLVYFDGSVIYQQTSQGNNQTALFILERGWHTMVFKHYQGSQSSPPDINDGFFSFRFLDGAGNSLSTPDIFTSHVKDPNQAFAQSPDHRYGSPPEFRGATWDDFGFDTTILHQAFPMALNGALTFDRWANLHISADGDSVSTFINGLEVVETIDPEQQFSFNIFDQRENNSDLWIGTQNPDAINVSSPISYYAFKIYQRKMEHQEVNDVWQGEGLNFSLYQYDIFGQYLDMDGDRVIDFYDDDFIELGTGISTVDDVDGNDPDYLGPIPSHGSMIHGRSSVTYPDPVDIATINDRRRTVIDDQLDEPYLEELITAQTIGFQDALIFWDFTTDNQAEVHDYVVPRWNPQSQCYEEVTLFYRPWVLALVQEEWNSVRAITDAIPALDEFGEFQNLPYEPTDNYHVKEDKVWPSFGSQEGQHFLTGVKGWFGFDDIMGYRDSIEKLNKEGMIFNYLQIEMRFRADRTELERHLEQYAQGYDQLFNDDYEGYRLRRDRR